MRYSAAMVDEAVYSQSESLYNKLYIYLGVIMRAVSYSEARQNLSTTMLQTVEDRAPVLITRQNGESCVLMSLEEYNSLEETAYLLRSPKNARRLMDSVESLKNGKGVERDIIE